MRDSSPRISKRNSKAQNDKLYKYLFFAALFLQLIFWNYSRNIRPEFDILPNPINKKYTKLASLGDDEFLFRSLSLRIQNSGDIYAGFTPLKFYDYQKLSDWFVFFDSLNSHSNVTPTLASYVYSNIDDDEKIRHLISYLEQRGRANIDQNWWWVFQSTYLARKINDQEKALELADLLAKNKNPKAPLWTKQISAFIHARNGDGCLAFFAIQNLVADLNKKNVEISAQDMNFIRYFINIRLKRLRNGGFNPNDCN